MAQVEVRTPRQEVSTILNDAIPEGEFVPREVAQKVLGSLRETTPELLAAAAEEMFEDWATDMLRSILHARRAHFAAVSGRVVFKEAADAFEENGDAEEFLSLFIDTSYPTEAGDWKPLGEMTGADHRFVAKDYEAKGKTMLLLGEFHRAVAKRVAGRRTSEVFTEERYLKLRNSIVGGDVQ